MNLSLHLYIKTCVKGCLHTTTYWSGCCWGWGLGPLSTTIFFHLHTRYSCSWQVDLTLIIIPPIRAICWVETSNLWILLHSLFKSICFLQILSHALALKFFTGLLHSNCKHHRTNTIHNYNNDLSTTPCIKVWWVRVVVVGVVINASLSLKIRP